MIQVKFYVKYDPSLPVVGDEIAVPVSGGQDWFKLGVFESAHLDGEYVHYILRLEDNLTDEIPQELA